MGAVVAPATAAPFLEGWLIDNHDWTWIFFMVLPLSLGAAGLLIVAAPTPARPSPPRRLDWIGLGAFGPAPLSASCVLTQGRRWDSLDASRRARLCALANEARLPFAFRNCRVGV